MHCGAQAWPLAASGSREGSKVSSLRPLLAWRSTAWSSWTARARLACGRQNKDGLPVFHMPAGQAFPLPAFRPRARFIQAFCNNEGWREERGDEQEVRESEFAWWEVPKERSISVTIKVGTCRARVQIEVSAPLSVKEDKGSFCDRKPVAKEKRLEDDT